MPQNTSRWALTYWLFGDRASIHGATQALATAVDTALTQVNSLALLAQSAAATAQGKADAGYNGYAARHRETTGTPMPVNSDFRPVRISERQFGWPLSQGSGQPTRIYLRRPGVYLYGGEIDYLPPSDGAPFAGSREAIAGVNGSTIGTPTTLTAGRADRSAYCPIATDVRYFENGDYLEPFGRHSQPTSSTVLYRAWMWAAYLGVLNP